MKTEWVAERIGAGRILQLVKSLMTPTMSRRRKQPRAVTATCTNSKATKSLRRVSKVSIVCNLRTADIPARDIYKTRDSYETRFSDLFTARPASTLIVRSRVGTLAGPLRYTSSRWRRGRDYFSLEPLARHGEYFRGLRVSPKTPRYRLGIGRTIGILRRRMLKLMAAPRNDMNKAGRVRASSLRTGDSLDEPLIGSY